MPLSTQFLFKQYTGIEGTDAIQSLINTASKAVETHLDRVLENTTIKEWYDGTGADHILLERYPITAILGVSISTQDVCDVSYSGGTFASVTINSTTLTLNGINTSGVLTETEFALASYPTIGQLATAIGAVSGWTATVASGRSNEPTGLIKPVIGSWCLAPDDMTIECIDETEPAYLVGQTDRMIRRKGGSIFPAGISNVLVYYKAGYTMPVDNEAHDALTTAGNVPYDLTMITNQLAKALYDSGQQDIGSADSMSLGDHSFSISDGSRGIIAKVLKENMGILGKYRRMI